MMWLEHSFTLLFANFVNISDISHLSASLTQCSYACISQTGCSSFFYSHIKRACQISTKRYFNSEGLAVDTDYVYFSIGSECPIGFDKLGSSCYFFSTWDTTYWNAKTNCSAFGSHLAVITSKEEDDLLRDYARTQGKAEHYVIGATDLRNEGTWLWETPLMPVNYTNWCNGQPDNALGSENCLELRKSLGNYMWNDQPCTLYGNFICEIEL